jgi:hypothetical protein
MYVSCSLQDPLTGFASFDWRTLSFHAAGLHYICYMHADAHPLLYPL